MTTLTESVYTGEFLVSEANNTLSREQVTLAPGLNLLSGTVLGRITDSDVYVPLDLLATDGSEQAAGVLYNNATTSSSGGDAVTIARQAEVDEQLLVLQSPNSHTARNCGLIGFLETTGDAGRDAEDTLLTI